MFSSKNSFRNTYNRVSKGLDPDQDRHSVGLDLGAKVISRRQKLLHVRKKLNMEFENYKSRG